jgi:hypothetical protein
MVAKKPKFFRLLAIEKSEQILKSFDFKSKIKEIITDLSGGNF